MAIITSAPCVLVGRRSDGRPPWTFLGGKTKPGEPPEDDAAVRETLEETGLWVRATVAMLDGVFERLGDGRDLMLMQSAE